MGEPLDITASGVFQDLAAFLILFSYVIPISLYVTLGLKSNLKFSRPNKSYLLFYIIKNCKSSLGACSLHGIKNCIAQSLTNQLFAIHPT